jgi:hypothetical protein
MTQTPYLMPFNHIREKEGRLTRPIKIILSAFFWLSSYQCSKLLNTTLTPNKPSLSLTKMPLKTMPWLQDAADCGLDSVLVH